MHCGDGAKGRGALWYSYLELASEDGFVHGQATRQQVHKHAVAGIHNRGVWGRGGALERCPSPQPCSKQRNKKPGE